MVAESIQVDRDHEGTKLIYDAIVVGAGFAGLRVIVEVRKLGLSFKVFEEEVVSVRHGKYSSCGRDTG
jgi:ribulose 1,5-bisphosphate synthetase/thiazole synthase